MCICVCTVHQNVQCDFRSKLHCLTEKQVKTCDGCFSRIIHNMPSEGHGMCAGSENLIRNTEHRSENNIDNITYKQWMTIDRSTLQTTVQSCIEFKQSSVEKLSILLHQSFKVQQPSYFHEELKFKYKTGEMGCDFSEN